jgi:DNA modification methylase
MVKNSTKSGEIVLDAFLGSGSTLIAAERLGRRCFGIELDARYVDVAVRRWEALTGQKAVRFG